MPNRAVPHAVSGPAASHANVLRVLLRSGVVRPGRPDRSIGQLRALSSWGATPAGGYLAAARSAPTSLAAIDERRQLTFAELWQRGGRLATALEALGAGPSRPVLLYARNHIGLLETIVATSVLGADVVLVNTGLSGSQVAEILAIHQPAVVVADQEFEPNLQPLPPECTLVRAWSDDPHDTSLRVRTLDGVIAEARKTHRRPPARPGRTIVLTSGTTAAPKGARRPTPPGLGAAASLLSRIPLRAKDRVLVSAPMMHTWGFAALQLSMALRACLVLNRRFDPEDALRTMAQHRCQACFAVPVMLQRILDLPATTRARYPLPDLRVVAISGSAMPAAAVTAFQDAFGDVLYNLYGSTEVSWASIADPSDLRAAPHSAGRPPLGTSVVVLDNDGEPVPPGVIGRLFVANDMLFDGYTDGGSKPRWDAFSATGNLNAVDYMATGDLGSVDESGLVFVSGRDDDMIISGGENTYPRPVEDAIAELPGVRDVAVFGVPDTEYGQRFAAYLVYDAAIGGQPASPDLVRQWCKARLPRFSVPRDVVFVDELPRNATGKVLLRELRALHARTTADLEEPAS
jgi:acyl-CoA synthetase (AMP-forming)/AMP-acid ligase II